MRNQYSPVVLFVYNRLEHTERTIDALKKNHLAEETDLLIYSDGPKTESDTDSVTRVRTYLKSITGFKTTQVIERERNYGLAESIIGGVSEILKKHGRVIVLEDDILTSKYFLEYMNAGLERYAKEPKVWHISGYFFPAENNLPDTFFYNQTSCWGWGTWQRAWEHLETDPQTLLDKIRNSRRLDEFDMNGNFRFSSTLKANIRGEIKTWAIKWHATTFLHNGLCLHPNKSLTYNIGHDGSGVHGENNSYLNNATNVENVRITPSSIPLTESREARKLAGQFLSKLKPTISYRVKKKILNLWKKL